MLPRIESLPPTPTDDPVVLVADADPLRRERLRQALSCEGIEAEVVADLRRVVDRLRVEAPDLLILDADHTPTALEVCAEVRLLDDARLTPVLLVSSEARDENTVARTLLCGADDFVHGALRMVELLARVRVQLRNHRDRWLLQWARQSRASFRRAAMQDPLLQIANRRAGDAALVDALDHGGPLMVAILDLDHFKRVNDTFGHAVGDRVLRTVAQALQRLTRHGDVVARYGGEEFVLILRGARPERAHAIAERFREGVANVTFGAEDGVRKITVSIGAATWDGQDPRPTRETLLSLADSALYTSKRAGRNRVTVLGLDEPSTVPSRNVARPITVSQRT
ncbi:MAG: diguanylate cyclase [Deltaproteobacteria bacterium]|nr:diguanylate cyclase [Deltaproteobacteria bacterium]